MTKGSEFRRSLPALLAGVIVVGALAWPFLQSPDEDAEPGPSRPGTGNSPTNLGSGGLGAPPGDASGDGADGGSDSSGTDGSAAGPARVTIDGGRLMVDGEPSPILQCVGYQPVPVGVSPAFGYRWANFPENYESDLPLLAEMGANTVAVNTRAASEPAYLRAFMSRALEHGLRVILVVDGPNEQDARDPAVQEELLAYVRGAAEAHRDHPALLAWQIGIEVDFTYRGTDRVADWYALFERATREVKGLDPNHPVFTASSVVTDPELFLEHSPSADIYGVNYYALNRQAMTSYLERLTGEVAGHPVLVTEFGADVLDNRTGTLYEETQAKALADAWGGVQAFHEAGAPVLGACVHEWSDQWWKGGELDEHDHGPTWPATDEGVLPDETFSEEWFGLVGIRPGSSERDVRLAYERLRDLWTEP